MFTKEVKIRSNNQIKSSDKKNLIKDILKQYPSVNEDELKNVIKVKDSEVCLSKAVTHDSKDVVIYFIDKIPYFFRIEKDELLLPTVYFLWKFPNIMRKFYTYAEVFGKLVNGADLMLPGVITKSAVNLYTFKDVKKGDLCCVCIRGNEAPVGIGRAHYSGEDMYMSGMRGKCLDMLHVLEDSLWALGDKSIKMPLIPSPIQAESSDEKSENENDAKQNTQSLDTDKLSELKLEDLEEKSHDKLSDEQAVAKDGQEESTEQKYDEESKQEDEKEKEEEAEIDHEKLLVDSFLCAAKFKSKEFKFPVIVSTFMKVMQSCCPQETQFDLKKTRFKKISVFLKEMESKGCIRTKEFQKGVLSITDISKENEMIKFFRKPDWLKQKEEAEPSKDDLKPLFDVFELFKVDGSTENFFGPTFRRGDILTPQQVRQFVTAYIKEAKLQSPETPRLLKLNESLQKSFLKNKNLNDTVTFEQLFEAIFNKMGHMHQIRMISGGNQEGEIRKGKFQPVEFKLESRAGNKKVTNIMNLYSFSLDANVLQSRIKKELGCSVAISEPTTSASATASNNYMLVVQGNQIYPISELLKNEFGIQLKHMVGLDLGVKP